MNNTTQQFATVQEIRKAFAEARASYGPLIASLPHKAKTPAQELLRARHGTPRTFARAVVKAIGEITAREAEIAILKYEAEWKAAK